VSDVADGFDTLLDVNLLNFDVLLDANNIFLVFGNLRLDGGVLNRSSFLNQLLLKDFDL